MCRNPACPGAYTWLASWLLPHFSQEKLPERGEAYLQFALLYSTVDGQRRVRVHTLALPITQSLGTAFRGADLDAYVSYVSRKVASQVRPRPQACCRACSVDRQRPAGPPQVPCLLTV